MSYKRLKQTLSKIQQRDDTITPQAIDRGNRSPRTPHQRIPKSPSASEQQVYTVGGNSKVEYTYGWYSASAENNDMQVIISKVRL
jgi:hypothetical protein